MKRKTVDLHIHSEYSSDGTFSVEKLFEQAQEHGMEAIVIADHDTWEAVHEAKEQARRTGILTIPALELSCIDENRMVHILGYGIETEKEHSLSRLIEKIQKSRIDILPKIKRNLEEEGFYVDMTQVEKLAYPHPPVITNFANAILQDPRNDGDPRLSVYRPGGSKADKPYIRFIKDYLVAGRKCYVPEYIVDIYTGIRAIREAGGIPVLAHPGEWFTKKDECKLQAMTECGLQGMEVYTPYHSEEQEEYFRQIAVKYRLFQTAGSDYHDEQKKPGHKMGMIKAADREMFRRLQQRIEKAHGEKEGMQQGRPHYKLLAVDVDGTLLDEEHRISEKNIEAIRKIQDDGVKVILFSGRGYEALKEILAKLALKDVVATQNGSVILDCTGQKRLREELISETDCREILAYCKIHGFEPLLYQKGDVYSKLKSKYLQIFEKCMDQKVIYTEDIEVCYSGEPLGKILVLDEPERIRSIKMWIDTHFQGRVSAQLAYDFSLEIGGSDKGSALRWIAKYYEISPDEIIAIGDGENDKYMLQYAGLGVAMGNAMESVKNCADKITLSNKESGVAFAIETFM
ncbi:Cof-type HAD-IIB family hydrolase [Mediterraneibacter massiliensis]|uniref:Cof-type HAD-IIB family hydrolase n=1 Tax=Mediterraneibacter massiliensis TaxID=1720300 RepID=UPI0009E8BA46|nr:Cof-type HAD-IIB family hydrolase [Mediterraneibacter massiliensis]